MKNTSKKRFFLLNLNKTYSRFFLTLPIALFSLSACQSTSMLSGLNSISNSLQSISGTNNNITVDEESNNRVVRRYQAALLSMLQSQEIFHEALEIDVDRQKTEGVAKMLEEGVVDKSELERATALTAENDALIREKLDSGVKLDEKARAKYTEALPAYALGTLNASLLGPEAIAYANEVQSKITAISSNPAMIVQVPSMIRDTASVLYVASELPTLISKWSDNTSTLITFGRENDVDVSKAEDAMSQVKL